MRVLILSPVFPSPPNTGTKIRIYHTIKKLSENHEVTLVSLTWDTPESYPMDELEKMCHKVFLFTLKKTKKTAIIKSVFSKYPYMVVRLYSNAFRNKINELLYAEKYDIVWTNRLCMSVFLDSSKLAHCITLLDEHNADELMFWRLIQNSSNIAVKFWGILNMIKMRIFRQKFMHYFDVCLSVSKQDADFAKKLAPGKLDVWIAPNGVDTDFFKLSGTSTEESIIMFCGSMDVLMNIDAAMTFAKEVFPLVRKEIPESQFWIVGKNPTREIRNLENFKNVKVTGTVEDVRPYYEKATVFVAPFKFGGGTKLKILEAMSMGVPIVATDIGCQGIEAVDGIHIVVENDMDNFAKKTICLLKDKSERERIANNGRSLVEGKYDWQKIIGSVEEKLKNMLGEGVEKHESR